MRIGDAATAGGMTVKAVRYYADLGLLGPVPRDGRYRDFQGDHIQRLRIIAHCREQGFSVAEIREVVALLPAEGCPPAAAMLTLVDAKLSALSAESEALLAKIRRLRQTRTYIADRMSAESE
jgi:DNA-binding transcriptional MerR regulator